ncbi:MULTISPECIES: TlpA family protein disulfide reductase [unclassified Janibacter]|uniref:TlpA family protein disulfide reductase n=1 Tax=unclassified Janibacter TaxID=2649294 RepID=UPI003D018B14
MSHALLLAPLALLPVLATAGVAKLRSSRHVADAVTSLRLPAALSHSTITRGLPVLELVVAGGLVLTSGAWATAAAGIAVVLLLAYAFVIARALSFDEPVTCHCFGEIGLGKVTRATVVRNVLLVVLALAALARTLGGARSVVAELASLSGAGWASLGVAVLVATLAWLLGTERASAGVPVGIAAASDVASSNPEAATTMDAGEIDPEDYVRTPIPTVPVTVPGGAEVPLSVLAAKRAQLLLFVSTTCRSCLVLLEELPEIVTRLSAIDVRVAFRNDLAEIAEHHPAAHPYAVRDGGAAARALGVDATPGAVLLGNDGLLAGGPIIGVDEIREFVDDIAEQLGV